MTDPVYVVLATLSWWAAIVKICQLIRTHDRALRTLTASLIAMAMMFTLSAPALRNRIDHVSGINDLSVILVHGSIVVFLASGLTMLLSWDEHSTRHGIILRCLPIAAGLAAMVILFVAAGRQPEQFTDFVADVGHDPYVSAYMLVYTATFTYVLCYAGVLCRRYLRDGLTGWARRGLATTLVGVKLGLIYCTIRLLETAASYASWNTPRWEVIPQATSVMAGVLLAAGWTMPLWGPHLSAWSAHRRLYPLWRAVCTAVPDVALATPRRLTDWLTLRELDFRVVRRVVEVHDALLYLRPHFDDDVKARARAIGASAGLDDRRVDALGEAGALVDRLEMTTNWRRPSRRRVSAPLARFHVQRDGEIATLLVLAEALRSPLLADVLSPVASEPRRRGAGIDRMSSRGFSP